MSLAEEGVCPPRLRQGSELENIRKTSKGRRCSLECVALSTNARDFDSLGRWPSRRRLWIGLKKNVTLCDWENLNTIEGSPKCLLKV